MSNYYTLYIVLSILLFHFSFCDDKGCQYRTEASQTSETAPYTDHKYLTHHDANHANQNKQSCFSLSYSDLVEEQCCYKVNSSDSKGYCIDQKKSGYSSSTPGLECPEVTKDGVTNNCGMALYYQPIAKDICTEISLVNGVCCFVQTKNHGNVCLRQDSIDEDNKEEITDYMKDYFKNKLKLNPDEEIVKVQCNGNYIKFYGMLLLLLAVIC